MGWQVWVITVVVIALIVCLDFVTLSRKAHEVMLREAAWLSVFYIGLALVFAGVLWVWQGPTEGTEFVTAYLVEKSLSVDNLFVFMVILTQFAVPIVLHERVLLFGIVMALVFRAVFIAIGAAALHYFSFTFVVFGALLIWTGVQLGRHRDEDPDPMNSLPIRMIRRRVPFTPEFDGNRFTTRVDGRRLATPLLVVIIAIGGTDVLFALDSIPATFGVTTNTYLVFTANAFALFGLRALYFLLKGLLDKLIYLSTGLAVILVFIGVKLILAYVHELYPQVPAIGTGLSLGVIALVLVVVTLASWIKVRRDPTALAHAGRLTDSSKVTDQK